MKILNGKRWFGKKPSFADTPPYTWDWSSLNEENFMKPFSAGRSPEIIQELTRGIYSIIAKGEDQSDKGVVFRYY